MAVLADTDFERFEPVGNFVGTSVGTRREWRINQKTGELRGVSIRERNKARKPKGWIDRKSKGWGDILASYEAWRRTARYAVGTFEQPPRDDDCQQLGEDRRKMPDKVR